MLLFVESSQAVHAEIEAVIRYYKNNEGHRIVLFGPKSEKLMLRIKMANYGADGIMLCQSGNLQERISDFVAVCEENEIDPSNARIVSSDGTDLASAILLGAEFTWAFDLY